MNARHAARELALLTLFQIDKQHPKSSMRTTIEPFSIDEMVLASVRSLCDEARSMLSNAAIDLAQVSRSILEIEYDDPLNMKSAVDALVKPVPMPKTRETVDKIEKCLMAAEYISEAMRIPELLALSKNPDVTQYANHLIQLVQKNLSVIDEHINACSQEWRVDRLVRLDAWILRIAAAEMSYVHTVDISVSIDEAVELAQEFSTEESFKYINGVLGALAKRLAAEKSSLT